ncbi:hypothetical protein [Motilibacter rhizosphaerae]|uniref:hypothetical protein n=1 Tax=Motilibacter rhizosphaerae TaxID=598652 RepID=UPI0013EE80C8|nr:hypothetical protein [Motilibacter rhizosphaerae]
MRPGVVPLRPLAVGEILDGAVQTARAHPRVVLGLSAVAVSVGALVGLVANTTVGAGAAPLFRDSTVPLTDDQATSALGHLTAATGISALVGVLVHVVLTGMLVGVLGRAVLGRPAPAGEVWREVRPRLLPLLGMTLLLALVSVLAVAVVVVVIAVAAVAVAPVAGALLAVPLLAGLVVLLAWLWTATGVAAPALVLEKQGVRGALRRSVRLVRGSFWRVLGIQLLVQIGASVAGGILGGVFSVAAFVVSRASDGSLYDVGPQLLVAVGSVVSGTLTAPIVACSVGLLYVDLRMRREGLDLELARAAA